MKKTNSTRSRYGQCVITIVSLEFVVLLLLVEWVLRVGKQNSAMESGYFYESRVIFINLTNSLIINIEK